MAEEEKVNELIDIKDLIDKDVYDVCVKYDLVNPINSVINNPGIISLDTHDFMDMLKEKPRAYYYGPIKDIELVKISDEKITTGIVQVIGNCDLTLKEVEDAMNDIRCQIPNECDIIMGTGFNKDLPETMIFALFGK